MNNAIFIPAIGIQFTNYWHYNRTLLHNGIDLKFFSPKSAFQYPYMLITAFYGMDYKDNNFREEIGYPKKNKLMGDSGGFEAATKGVRPNPEAVLKWLEANTDYAMNLDIPYEQASKRLPTRKEFDFSLKESASNFEYFEKHRKNYDTKFYNVLHGESWKYMNEWYDKVKHHNFESWAIGLKPPEDIYTQILGFSYLYEKGALENSDGLHFFGMSGTKITPVIAYLTRKYLKKTTVTFDSSSYNVGAIYRAYFCPFKSPGLRRLFFGEKFKDENPYMKTLPCFCPVCSKCSVEDYMASGDYRGCLISLHNLWLTIHYTKWVNSMIGDESNFSEDLQRAFEFADFCVEKGTKAGFEHKKPEIKQGKNANIFSFDKGTPKISELMNDMNKEKEKDLEKLQELDMWNDI